MLRNPNTIPAGDTVIEDPIMEPFFITHSSSGGYAVYERVTRGKDGKAYLRTVCYPSTFNYALRAISKELLNYGSNKHFSTIKEYIEEWNSIEQSMRTMTTLDT
jgi:hypothetical protein